MDPVNANEYGCKFNSYVSDMTGGDDLISTLKNKKIPYVETTLNMGSLFADPATLVSYRTPTKKLYSVLVIPQRGPDSWLEEYWWFPEISHEAMLKMDLARFAEERFVTIYTIKPK